MEDVGRWLEAEGFAPEVVAAFAAQEVDGETALNLGMRDLEVWEGKCHRL